MMSLFARQSHAEAGAEPIRVELDAPAVCGTPADFLDAVRRHTERVRPSAGDAGERRLVIRVMPAAEGFEGSLWLVDPETTSAERRMTSTDCGELMEALAIVAALAVDPSKSDEPAAANGGVAGSSTPPASAPPAVIVPPPPVATPPSDAKVTPAAVSERNPSPAAWFLGAELGVDALVATPMVFPTGGLDAEVVFRKASFLHPDLRFAVRRSLEATVSSASGSASFALTTLRIAACPLRFDASRAVRMSPCAVLDAGALSGAGHDVERQQSTIRPWVGAGLEARLTVGARNPRLGLGLGLIVPFVQDTFRFYPSEVVYEVKGVLPFASVSVTFGPIGGAAEEQ